MVDTPLTDTAAPAAVAPVSKPSTVSEVVATMTPVADAAQRGFVAFVSAHPKTACVLMALEAIAIAYFAIKGAL